MGLGRPGFRGTESANRPPLQFPWGAGALTLGAVNQGGRGWILWGFGAGRVGGGIWRGDWRSIGCGARDPAGVLLP